MAKVANFNRPVSTIILWQELKQHLALNESSLKQLFQFWIKVARLYEIEINAFNQHNAQANTQGEHMIESFVPNIVPNRVIWESVQLPNIQEIHKLSTFGQLWTYRLLFYLEQLRWPKTSCPQSTLPACSASDLVLDFVLFTGTFPPILIKQGGRGKDDYLLYDIHPNKFPQGVNFTQFKSAFLGTIFQISRQIGRE